MNTEIIKSEIVNAQDYGLTEKQGIEISSKFQILEEEKGILLFEYSEIIKKELSPELSVEAKLLDSKMQKHLKSKKDIHTANKSFFLNGGRFVDSIYNLEKVEFELMRETTKRIKNYAEDLEKERVAKLQFERVDLLSQYVQDASERDLSSMDEDVWQSYLGTKKQSYLDVLQAEKDAEKERQDKIEAEKKEQERIRLENVKLKEEAQAKEKALEKERKEAKDKQYAIELKARKEREEADQKAESLRKEQAIKDAKAKAEKDAIVKAEEKRVKDEEQWLQDELNKGDEAKVKDLINGLGILKTKYVFKAAKTQKMYLEVGLLIDKMTNHIKQ
jgi:hypothetical protein